MDHTYALTKMAVKGGCAAKLGQGVLTDLLKKLPKMQNPAMLVGFESSDDAAVYRVNEEQAIIQTMDFFPPVVDDPYLFGQIAAANALSDVYAMGGVPTMAMNLLCIPSCLDLKIAELILRGGYEKVLEAGAVIGGGHTIEDHEPKYGLAVMGMVHPDHIWRNDTARAGDVLVFTKKIGTGIYSLASRGGLLTPEEEEDMIYWMTLLNRRAKELLDPNEVHACTDITGFGVLGHLYEMASGSGVTIHVRTSRVPFLEKAGELAEMGIVPSGAYANAKYLEGKVIFEDETETKWKDCLLDPQTSGGLMAAMKPDAAEQYVERMRQEGQSAEIIGYVTEKEDSYLRAER